MQNKWSDKKNTRIGSWENRGNGASSLFEQMIVVFMTVIVISSCFVFDIQTGLFSLTGLLAKWLVIDNVIESINRCKVFLIVCDDPDPICEFIYRDLKRSATVYKAHGAFTHNQKMIIMSVMKRGQAVQLRNFVKRYQPGAFIAIVNSSEIIGKGFRGLNWATGTGTVALYLSQWPSAYLALTISKSLLYWKTEKRKACNTLK